MKRKSGALVIFAVMIALAVAPNVVAQETNDSITAGGQEVKIPETNVPGIFTLSGEFARIAYNNEGWVTLGYRAANNSQGQEWMLLEVGTTIRKPTPSQKIERGAFSLTLPDESTVAMASQQDYSSAGYLRALNGRADTVRDSINYFPAEANQACPIGFFSDVMKQGVSFDVYELNWQRGCLGRIFFQIPDGITPGQYFLNVKFQNSMVRVPFRIFTDEEQKFAKKNWKDIKKQHEAFLKEEAAKAKKKAADQQKK